MSSMCVNKSLEITIIFYQNPNLMYCTRIFYIPSSYVMSDVYARDSWFLLLISGIVNLMIIATYNAMLLFFHMKSPHQFILDCCCLLEGDKKRAERAQLNSADGDTAEFHDQFYRDHKLLLVLFRALAVMPITRSQPGKCIYAYILQRQFHAATAVADAY